jgi:hypothetical protein
VVVGLAISADQHNARCIFCTAVQCILKRPQAILMAQRRSDRRAVWIPAPPLLVWVLLIVFVGLVLAWCQWPNFY